MREFKTFSDLAEALKVRVNKRREFEDVRTCRKCGGIMRLVDGTNVYVCEGNHKNSGECYNRAIKRVSGFNGEGSPCYISQKKEKKPS